ncbi:hypothetical protein C8J56DRAFT_949634 [Mycena floridula]|nr:hypothetical protein C8J56DRAFT_949634 [Mycena floridula]
MASYRSSCLQHASNITGLGGIWDRGRSINRLNGSLHCAVQINNLEPGTWRPAAGMMREMEESESNATMLLRIFILCLGILANAERHPRYQYIVSSAQLSFYFCAGCLLLTFINVSTLSIDSLRVILTWTTDTSVWDAVKDSELSFLDAISAALFLSAVVRLVLTRNRRRVSTISQGLSPSEKSRVSYVEKQ